MLCTWTPVHRCVGSAVYYVHTHACMHVYKSPIVLICMYVGALLCACVYMYPAVYTCMHMGTTVPMHVCACMLQPCCVHLYVCKGLLCVYVSMSGCGSPCSGPTL